MPRNLASEFVNDACLASAWVVYLDELASWTHAATFTFKRRDDKGYPCTNAILLSTARHFIKAVNYGCFKKKSQHGQSIASAVTYGWGAYGDHPHIHCSFEAPDFMSFDEFTTILTTCKRKIYWFDQEMMIKPYVNAGWGKYLIEHGTDCLIDSLLIPSRSIK